eukprot:10801888-Karenia_brevis.AAC.1
MDNKESASGNPQQHSSFIFYCWQVGLPVDEAKEFLNAGISNGSATPISTAPIPTYEAPATPLN